MENMSGTEFSMINLKRNIQKVKETNQKIRDEVYKQNTTYMAILEELEAEVFPLDTEYKEMEQDFMETVSVLEMNRKLHERIMKQIYDKAYRNPPTLPSLQSSSMSVNTQPSVLAGTSIDILPTSVTRPPPGLNLNNPQLILHRVEEGPNQWEVVKNVEVPTRKRSIDTMLQSNKSSNQAQQKEVVNRKTDLTCQEVVENTSCTFVENTTGLQKNVIKDKTSSNDRPARVEEEKVEKTDIVTRSKNKMKITINQEEEKSDIGVEIEEMVECLKKRTQGRGRPSTVSQNCSSRKPLSVTKQNLDSFIQNFKIPKINNVTDNQFSLNTDPVIKPPIQEKSPEATVKFSPASSSSYMEDSERGEAGVGSSQEENNIKTSPHYESCSNPIDPIFDIPRNYLKRYSWNTLTDEDQLERVSFFAQVEKDIVPRRIYIDPWCPHSTSGLQPFGNRKRDFTWMRPCPVTYVYFDWRGLRPVDQPFEFNRRVRLTLMLPSEIGISVSCGLVHSHNNAVILGHDFLIEHKVEVELWSESGIGYVRIYNEKFNCRRLLTGPSRPLSEQWKRKFLPPLPRCL